jgi:D-amino-acid oxidase
LYPTRGQTLLIAEPKTPISRMYEFERLNKYEALSSWVPSLLHSEVAADRLIDRYIRSPARVNPTTAYVFPRPLGGGVILGGSRQENNWSDEWDENLGNDIMKRCCELCPELGRPEDLKVISKNIGLRRESRTYDFGE